MPSTLFDDEESEEIFIKSYIETTNNENKTEFEEERNILARKETKAVSVVRLTIVFVLLVAACGVCLMVYFYTKSNEQVEFEKQFEDYANKIIESFSGSLDRKLGAIDSLSIAITSFAKATEAKFPNVTLPNYTIRGSSARVMSNSVIMTYAPLVTDDNRKGWEAYSVANNDLVEQDAENEIRLRKQQDEKFQMDLQKQQLQQEEETEQQQQQQLVPFLGEIYSTLPNGTRAVKPNGSGPYAPYWQVSPLGKTRRQKANGDLLSHHLFGPMLKRSIKTKKAVFNKAMNLKEPGPFNSESYSDFLRNGQYRHQMALHTGDPVTHLAYPVFDDFGSSKTVAGVLVTNMYFRLYFTNVLPANARGIICVVENSFNQTFTYQIDGPDATFLGTEDRHNSLYDPLVVSNDVTEYLQRHSGASTSSYTVVALDDEYCRYKLRIYPSASTEDAYMTRIPLVGAIIVACVFIFTSTVFLLYDWLVQRRQNIIMDRAVASGAIVSSLFPKDVKDRLIEETDSSRKQKQGFIHSWCKKEEKQQGKLTMSLDGINDASSEKRDLVDPISRAISYSPIAKYYSSTTVLFADISAFTAWSANHTPDQVFILLEMLYNAMDKIAELLQVYKIETIGDCYVAVTGLPEPQDNHAVIMTKFAIACLNKMNKLTGRLKDTLGEDTTNLQLRVGLHSGAVTAGVLRGRKSRFQLFGDTMNMASRMESNGVKGRIHVSQATADELAAKGKSDWITPRENKIMAKGKGEVQTYFIDFRQKRSSQITASTISDTIDADSFCQAGGNSVKSKGISLDTI